MSQVDWEDEKNCLQGISAALGNFYAMHTPLLPNPSGDGLQFYKRSKHLSASDDGGIFLLLSVDPTPCLVSALKSVIIAFVLGTE